MNEILNKFEPESKDALDKSTDAEQKDIQIPKAKERMQPKKEIGLDKKLQTVSFAITALSFVPSESQEKIMNGLLERAGIPTGAYEYSLELREQLIRDCKTLEGDVIRYQKANSKDDREKALQILLERTETYVENLVQKFVLDNTPNHQIEERQKLYQKNRTLRIQDTYKIDLLSAQMKICLALAQADESKALTAAKEYIREKYLGIKSLTGIDEKSEKIVIGFAKNLLSQTEAHVMPVLTTKVREFAKQNYVNSFWNRAKQTGNFALDWIKTPFSSAARSRMAQSITPVVSMNKLNTKKDEGYFRNTVTAIGEVSPTNALMKTAPIMCDFAKTAFQVSMNHKEALILLASVAGAVSFDLAMMAATWGVGSVLKGAQVAGTAVKTSGATLKAFSTATGVFSAGKMALRPLYGLSNTLSFSKLEEKVNEKVIKDARN